MATVAHRAPKTVKMTDLNENTEDQLKDEDDKLLNINILAKLIYLTNISKFYQAHLSHMVRPFFALFRAASRISITVILFSKADKAVGSNSMVPLTTAASNEKASS